MKNIIISPQSLLRKFFPLVRRTRQWAWKYNDRIGIRLVISGGKIQFMDAELNFPERVGLTYSTPLFWNGADAYEATTSRALALLISRAKLFLDIGSNIGIYSVYAGVKFPTVKTFAFEPVPAIWKKNCLFHRANQLPEENVLNVALSDSDEKRKLFLPVFTTGIEEEQTATLNPISWQAYEEKVETIEIQCVMLDTFATTTLLPDGMCVLKIDVENVEAAVLRGGKNFIASRRPWIICEILPCEEFNPVTKTKRNNNRETLALIEEFNYAVFAICAEGFFRMTAADFSRPRLFKDFLFLPREKISGDIFYFALENLASFF